MHLEAVETTTLPNGLRIVSERVPYVQSASIGVWVDVGARHERPDERGITHFIEHMLFKGTERRTAKDIASEIESVGGGLNAFTEKEYTCYYARALADHAPLVMDVLSDMIRHSTLDETELSREQNVVIEEIKRYEDTPDDIVHDLFARAVWRTHPLGRPIVGTARSVSAFTADGIRRFMGTHYRPPRMVVAAAGNITHKALTRLVLKHFGDMTGDRATTAIRMPAVRGTRMQRSKRSEQVHFCLGGPTYAQTDDRRYPLTILDMVLGGNMSSRLFQEVREKRGLAYAIGSYTAAFRDCGLLTVYGGTSPDTLGEVLKVTEAELDLVRREGLTDDEIARAKTQIRGSLIIGLESMSSRMMRLGKSTLYHDRVIPLDEIVAHVNGVTRDDIIGVARDVLAEDRLSFAAIGPFGRGSGER
ncbi:MAG: insulinase family protein [Armatimonadetes bacterium]|nr:insulinase family protein [Armatimonadota bacterium]